MVNCVIASAPPEILLLPHYMVLLCLSPDGHGAVKRGNLIRSVAPWYPLRASCSVKNVRASATIPP
eukprot:11157438-Lingulodinium_polyedra.AAC.1